MGDSGVERVFEELWTAQDSPEFQLGMIQLEARAQGGDLHAARALAEMLHLSGPHFDAAQAYFWQHILAAKRGADTRFANRGKRPGHYQGRPGDFRNAPDIAALVHHLGFARAKALDRLARDWLRLQEGA